MARTVVNSRMVAHLWAHQTQESARNGQRTLFFEGDTIYSYGEHFPIARHVQGASGLWGVVFTTRRYSITTSVHCSDVRRAIPPGLEVISCDHVNGSHEENRTAFRTDYEHAVQALAKAKRNHKLNRWREARETADQANRYAEFFGLEWGEFTAPFLEGYEALLAEETERRGQRERRRGERRRQTETDRLRAGVHLPRRRRGERRRQTETDRLERQCENLARWQAGENVPVFTFGLTSGEYFLRVKGEGDSAVLETTGGAEVPLRHALRILPLIRRGEAYQRNGHTERVGVFAVDAIDAEGNVRIGCHYIKRAEIERVAAQLGV